MDAVNCTPDALAIRASGNNQDKKVTAAIAVDSDDALEAPDSLQGSVDEDDAGLAEAEALPGTCSDTPNPAVAAIVTLGAPQRPPATGALQLPHRIVFYVC